MPAEIEAFTARIVGRVQGVGFRYATSGEATRLGLTGWVRNAGDGSVEVFAQGDRAPLDRMRAFLQHGPPAARVQAAEFFAAEPDPGLSPGFRLRF